MLSSESACAHHESEEGMPSAETYDHSSAHSSMLVSIEPIENHSRKPHECSSAARRRLVQKQTSTIAVKERAT